jgi:hypothetical protein
VAAQFQGMYCYGGVVEATTGAGMEVTVVAAADSTSAGAGALASKGRVGLHIAACEQHG